MDANNYTSPTPNRRSDIHRASSHRNMSQEIEQVVTDLLRTTRALLEALNLWSQLRSSTNDIYEIHRSLETQFYRVTHSFDEAGIDTGDLAWIPNQLGQSVTDCMNQEPSPATLDQHLPRIRDVIVHLLHGLKAKQQKLREQPAPAHPQPETWHHRSSVGSASGSVGRASPTRSATYDRLSSAGSTSSHRSNYDPYTSGMPKPAQCTSQGTSAPSRSYPRHPSKLGAPGPPAPPPPPPPVTGTPSMSRSDFDESDPNTASALAALKRQENLARRSSVRRASMYRGNTSADYASKRFMNEAPPMPTIPSSMSTPTVPSQMGRLDEEDHQTASSTQRPLTPVSAPQQEPTTTPAEPVMPGTLTLFLQVDKQVKKIEYSGDITLPALSMLFIERFGYNAGQEDFPSIYIRDPSGQGIAYELQDLNDVVHRSILSLNTQETPKLDAQPPVWVDTLVQQMTSIQKDHDASRAWMTEQLGQLKKDLETKTSMDLKATEASLQETLTSLQSTVPVRAPASPADAAPSNESSASIPPPPPPPPMPSADPSKIKSLEEQVDKLQRQVMVLRQSKVDVEQQVNSLKEQLEDKTRAYSALETKSKQDLLSSKTGSTPSQQRQYIENGKTELLGMSDKITNRLEDLQDMIDHIKLDVTQRKCRPSGTQMQHCGDERKALGEEIAAFGQYIGQVKPVWKKTWEQELQNIVKEQQTLKEQEGLLLDMKDDLEALQEVYEQLEKICAYQAKSKPVVREFLVKPAEDGHEGMSSVLRQIATIDVDNDRRLKALEMADKMRQRELANRIDEFEEELSHFVDQKKLKKTGGAAEIDRLRQEKDRQLLQDMYKKKNGTPADQDPESTPASPSTPADTPS
ncbi:AIP3-domain-containing protein [Hesseltinella vesiculosa]|uniref:AIP3-domain-containing protein n=1 Tax=Hesseltinella vesiculosa TaxID=101127 RepID=A0A1X2GPD3_9FUNG|nr:AIP3-domain-containing protein [Hesseltinella vesiculosa]